MDYSFIYTAGRGIDVDFGPAQPGLTETLADSVSSMPPRNDTETGLSTYWIDAVMRGLDSAEDGSAFMWGNSTAMVRQGSQVVARSSDELFEDELIDVDDLKQILRAWRTEVLEHRREFEIAETYRRNGYR